MKKMIIREGDKFVCVKKVKMTYDKRIEYKKGYLYKSEKDNCITNESGNIDHFWDIKSNNKFFVKIKNK